MPRQRSERPDDEQNCWEVPPWYDPPSFLHIHAELRVDGDLTGSQFMHRMTHLADHSASLEPPLTPRESKHQQRYQTRAQTRWKQVTRHVIKSVLSFARLVCMFNTNAKLSLRGEKVLEDFARDEAGLLVIHPVVDGRMMDVGRPRDLQT